MSVMDARPSGVELRGYAGDTLSFYVTSDEEFSGYTWAGQVRTDHVDSIVDVSFDIGPTTSYSSGGITRYRTPIVLSAANTRTLANLAVEENAVPQYVKINGVRTTLSSLPTYTGVWDIQVTQGDVTKTIVQGTIIIDADVTRS